MKRAISAAQGRVHRRLKRACHVKFDLDSPGGNAQG
jgi:ribosomal protein L22